MRASLLGVVLLFATACDAWLTKPSLYNTVTVIASQRSGAPIPGVKLVLYTGQRPMGYATTGTDGRHVFSDVPQGNYGVNATPPAGYDPLETLIRGPVSTFQDKLLVADDTLQPVHFTFLKRGPGTVSVHLIDPVFGDVRGASVTLYTPTTVEAKAATDASGRATFANVAFGVHGVIVERPLLYRDYRTPGDSLFSHQDDIIVDEGSADTATFQMRRCAGTMRATAVDDVGAPVANATVVFYTSTQPIATIGTTATGVATLAAAPCVIQLGMNVTPPAGYSVTEGRGSRFFDGLTLSNGGVVQATFRLHRVNVAAPESSAMQPPT